jgi:hypothetical protein
MFREATGNESAIVMAVHVGRFPASCLAALRIRITGPGTELGIAGSKSAAFLEGL